MSLPEVHPISDLARDARGVIERARQRREPVVITQRGREVAVLVPVELYRDMERRQAVQIFSPRLVRPEDARRLRVQMTVLDELAEEPSAGL